MDMVKLAEMLAMGKPVRNVNTAQTTTTEGR